MRTLILCSLFLCGCSLVGNKTSATRDGVSSDTPINNPGSFERKDWDSYFLVDRESVVEQFSDGSYKVTNPVPGKVVSARVDVKSITPTSFTPQAGPSEHEKAEAFGLRWFYLAGVLFAVAACVLTWQGHIKAAIVAGVGAIAVPLAGRIATQISVGLCVGLAICSITLWAAWHFLIRKFPKLDSATNPNTPPVD